MFTSSGYFRGLNCPYFMSGLCERTYCHFRHSKPALEKESLQRSLSKDAGETSVPASYGGPSSSLSVTIDSDGQYTTATTSTEESGSPECSPEKSAEDENTNKEDGCKIGPYGKYWPTQQYEPVSENSGSSTGVHYTPTPISALENKSPPKEEKIVITHAKGGAMLEYNPTPIVQLQQMRRKPSHRLRGKSAEGMEYDPESNFSTVGKPVKEDGASRKRTHCEDLSPVEYVPTKRNHLDQEAEFSDNEDIENVHVEAYEPDGAEENLPEYIPTSKTSSKYPVDSSDIDNKSDSSLTTEDEKKEENRPKTPVPDSRLSMDDYLKLLLNPTKPSQSPDTASQKFELKKKSKDSNSNSAREKSTKVDQNSSIKKKNDSSNSVSSKTSKDSKSDSSSKNSSSKYCKDSNRKDADVKGIGKDGKLSDGQRRSSKENDSSKSHKRNGESYSSRSSSSHSSKNRSSQSHSHRSSSSKHKSSSESSAKSDSSKHHSSSQKSHSTSHKSEPTSGEKVRHSSSDKAKSRHSQKTEKSSDTVITNGHSGKESDSKNSMKRSISQSESGTPKQKKKPLHVNLDLFGHDSDISDDNSVRRANFDGGEDRDSDDTFRGDNLDSDLETTLDISDLDEDVDTYEECLRIFNETKHHVKLPNVGKSAKKEPQEEKASLGKKRVAHSLDVKPVKKIMERPMSKLSPAQVMHNRFVQMQKRALEAAKANHSSQEASTSGTGPKSRMAHGASLAARSKEKLTIATASKTEKRQAHVPVVASLPRPTVPADFGSKIPTNVRQRYLNLMIDECLKLCKTEKEAYDRALEEEQACYNRASSKNIYLNVSVNAIKKLRVEITNKKNKTPSKADSATTLSHEAMLGGLKATQISYTLNRSQGAPKAQTADFLGAELYRRLESYILAEDQLVENGFPRWDPDNPGTPTIQERNFGQTSPKKAISKVNQKLCVRCGKRFEVFPNGKYAVKEECVYHWGKAWKRKIAGAIETRYTCCSSELDVKGCQVCPLHVYDSNKYDNLSGFMRTLPSSPPIDGDYGTYAMDCEMVYTHGGCELARVTVIAPDYSAIYESLVKPDKPVIDYNTRFSGITAEDLKGVTTSLRDVQAILLSLLTDRTILLGHSLESDLIATKLIHSTVVDTSVVFPHRLGPPYKRALKTLMGEYLQKIIQDDVGGHDSHEDAASCLELMQLKLKQDAKKQVRRN